jgi:hypothetical protein
MKQDNLAEIAQRDRSTADYLGTGNTSSFTSLDAAALSSSSGAGAAARYFPKKSQA